MSEFLLELFSEEIPARMQKRAAEDLNRLIIDGLQKNTLTFDSSFCHVTPHRLCVVVNGLLGTQPNTRDERRGPRVDAPNAAIQGFLNSVGVSRDDLEERDTKKGRFLFAVIEKPGQETTEILPTIIDNVIREMPWPKSMRWASNSFRWVRPLHHILAIFDSKKIDGQFDLGNEVINYTNMTRGHRFMAPQSFEVSSFLDYEKKLNDAYVIVDREKRKSIIIEQIKSLTHDQNMEMESDPSLLEEVCGLIEWPNALIGKIQDEFMAVPSEALVCAMRSHQKYFAFTKHHGGLAPNFVTVSNMPSDPNRDKIIVSGNEKVLSARLSDAKFFWDQDKAITLKSRIPELTNITFYDKLGSLGEKIVRIESLGEYISQWVPGAEKEMVQRAAPLSKADLTTSMVGEFPELQGVMGGYYANNDGEGKEVCLSIKEHYSPQGPSDFCPTAPLSVVLSLADKIDTLVGFFALNEKPTGSKDPFALRRYALGVIRLIMHNSLQFPLEKAITKALSIYPDFRNDNGLIDFIMERLKVFLRNEGMGHDRIASIFAIGNEDDINKLVSKVRALDIFLSTDDGINLLIAYRRAANMVAIESKKDNASFFSTPDEKLFQLEPERELAKNLAYIQILLPSLVEGGEFDKAMEVLATLRTTVDAYFDNVTVNAGDVLTRKNRLNTLNLIVDTMNTVANFSLIEN